MTCPQCSSELHEDSTGVTACISCGYRTTEYRPKDFSYNNADIMRRDTGVEIPLSEARVGIIGKRTEGATTLKRYGEFETNDAGTGRIYGGAEVNDAGEKFQSTEETLKERGNRYGEFVNHATLSQNMKILFHEHVKEYGDPEYFTDVMVESIDMIFHKLARIANGDPTYADNYVDICGYSQLVVDELNKR